MRDIHDRYGLSSDHPAVVEALSHITMTNFARGETILLPDEPPEFMYIIDSGLVKASTYNKKGEEFINLIYGPGELFPLGAILKKVRRDSTFIALNDSVVGLLPIEIFFRLLKDCPDVTQVVLNKALATLLTYTGRVTNLEYQYGRERIAFRLLMLGDRFGVKDGEKLIIPPISQQDLAATMNMSRESVNREIARYERLGYVDYSRKGIVLLNTKELHREIGGDESAMFANSADSPSL